jgi:hypothetical protein
MLLIFSTPVLSRHLLQLKIVVFLHWYLIQAVSLHLQLLRPYACLALGWPDNTKVFSIYCRNVVHGAIGLLPPLTFLADIFYQCKNGLKSGGDGSQIHWQVFSKSNTLIKDKLKQNRT